VTDAEVDAFYEQNKDRIGDAPPADIKVRIKEFLTDQKKQEAAQAYVAQLRRTHRAVVLLEPPRVQVEALGFLKGPENAPITIIEFADYECGYCGRARDSMREVMAKYPGKIRLVFRDFPLSFHPNATPAAIAARCAGAQGKFWEMHNLLFDHQSELTTENFMKWAGELGLDLTQFEACGQDPRVKAQVDADLEAGSAVGVSGTPAFFVNGVSLSGAQPVDAFVQIIERELAR
jgi:protein-disulfide isomerase